MSGNNTHLRMQYAWRHAIQSNECRKQIPFKRLEINPLSLMNQLINHPFLCSATSQECSVEWPKRNLRGIKNCNEWPDCYLYYTASRVSLSQVPWWVAGITLPKAENLSFLPSIAPKAPSDHLELSLWTRAIHLTETSCFSERIFDKQACVNMAFFICRQQQCVGVFSHCHLWTMSLLNTSCRKAEVIKVATWKSRDAASDWRFFCLSTVK